MITKLEILACVDTAMILNNCKIVAQDTPGNLVTNESAKIAYFESLSKLINLFDV